MNLTADIINSNQPIGQTNVGGNFIAANDEGQKQGAVAYQQQLQTRLQNAIHESIDSKGDIDYNKLAKTGQDLGIDSQTMDYSIKHLQDNWDMIRKVAEDKYATGFTSPSGAAAENANAAGTDANANPATPAQSWANKPAKAQEKANAPAVPTTPVINESDEAKTPTPEGRSDVPAGQDTPATMIKADTSSDSNTDLGSSTLTGTVPVQGKPDNMYSVANKMSAADSGALYASQNIPKFDATKVAGLSDLDKQNKKQGLANAGYVIKNDQDLADALNDVQFKAVQAVFKDVNPLSKEGPGAMMAAAQGAPKAALDAIAGLSSAGQSTKSARIGNDVTLAGNARAQIPFDQTQANVSALKAEGYDLATQDNAAKILDLKGAYQGIRNSKSEIERIRDKGKTLTDDQFNAQYDALLTNIKNAENIGSISGDENLMSNLRKDRTYGQLASTSTNIQDFFTKAIQNAFSKMSRGERLDAAAKLADAILEAGQVKGKLDAYKSKSWADNPAATKTETKKSGWYKDSDGVMRNHK